MIVWSGKGFLAVIVLIASFAVSVNLFPKEQSDYAFILAFFATAAFSWFMGKKWNEQDARTFIDKSTGQEIVFKANHSLFWIKLQYWGIIFSIFGFIILLQNLR
ncbi:hypothetical protein [Chryseolinea sp. H1M3-3]|uniref:hypothetical protein n=1 Tax=Chryseolinea sp. H1M3-3 TaxID=3034144 RepID=UPI0023EC7ACB|nr:hypothetical protein [Chryseolinea sp. H1M3-3]